MVKLIFLLFEINLIKNKDEEMKEELAGTTAVCVIIRDKKIYCVRKSF
jgi:hypothetical protein